jgi:hypothetical protein
MPSNLDSWLLSSSFSVTVSLWRTLVVCIVSDVTMMLLPRQ